MLQFPKLLQVLCIVSLFFASNVNVFAQQLDDGKEFEVDKPPVPVVKPSDSSLLDDYVNCPPDDVQAEEPESVSVDPPMEQAVPQRKKFDDYALPVKDANDRPIRLTGMRPRDPFDEVTLMDDKEDAELLDMTKNMSIGEVGRVFETIADSQEASDDDEPQQKIEAKSEQIVEDVIENGDTIHVSQQLPKVPIHVVVHDSAINTETHTENGPLKYLEAETLYNLVEGETRAQGLKKFLKQHPEEIILESPNYPNPYPNEVNDMRNFSVDGGRGVQITIHDLDLNPTTDFLYLRAGKMEDVDEEGPVLTGTYQQPLRFLIPQTTFFTIHFVAQQNSDVEQKHRGFKLTYAPFGEVNSPTTPTTTEAIVPQEELQWASKEIVMTPELMEMPSTWEEIKVALSNASNQYIENHNLTYMPSRPFDVKLLARKCPDTWRNFQNCVTLEFAVPLRPIFYEPSEDDEGMDFGFGNKFLQKGFISISTTEATGPRYELDVDNLNAMWDEIGQMEVQRAGYELYIMPENSRVLLTWIGISLAIVCTFLFVLYMIWKIDIFKDYRRISRTNHGVSMDDDKNELKKKEFDISMFPSPHQVVPTFFPTGDPYNAADAEAQYAYDNTTMSQWPEDFNEPRYPETSFSSPGHQALGNQRTGPTRPYEPVSPMDLSPAPVDFNDSPRPMRSSAGGRNNPFLSPRGGPRTSTGNPPPPPPPPVLR
ncbi:uncharacterized protein LOC128723416 [Anopheles nili]|uniref:uncharacterized protein LOC128723416 n=1 Tax=Anopheles nili TaxID=185578 RepID=UPI00237AA77A|nr:uncharacterized protein LOC128723416 [Anopheles nili]